MIKGSVFLAFIFCLFPVQVMAEETSSSLENYSISLAVSISDNFDKISGIATIKIPSSKVNSSIPLMLYPNRFKNQWKYLDEHLVDWIYPKGQSKGEIDLKSIFLNGKEITKDSLEYVNSPLHNQKTIALIPIDKTIKKQKEIILEITFTTIIPKRRGRFGRFNNTLSAAGGWFPRPAYQLPEKENFLPAMANIQTNISLPPFTGLLLENEVFQAGKNRQVLSVKAENNTVYTLIAYKNMFTHKHCIEKTCITFLSANYHSLPQKESFSPLKRILEITQAVYQTIKKNNPIFLNHKQSIIIAQVPTHDQLVQTSGSNILVSDQVYKLLPIPRARVFHDVALARHIASALIYETSKKREPLGDVEIVASLMGILIGDMALKSLELEAETLHGLVGFASFIPYIDSLIYAPQIPFEEAYSTSVEPPSLRDEPWRFHNDLPLGVRILAKLEDLFQKDKTRDLLKYYLENTFTFKELLASLPDNLLHQFFSQWWGSYPAVTYGIKKTKSKKIGPNEYEHYAYIKQEGEKVLEPVEVKFHDRRGNQAVLIWFEDQNPLIWQSPAKLKFVEIDPNFRLVEAILPGGEHPRQNNRSLVKLRPPLFTQFVIWADTATKHPYANISFSMRPQFDNSKSISLAASYDQQKKGTFIGFYRYYGEATTLNSRNWYAGPGLSVYNYDLKTKYQSLIPEENYYKATITSVRMILGKNNTEYFFDPKNVSSFYLSLGYGIGKNPQEETLSIGSLSFRYFFIRTPRLRHSLAFYGGFDGVSGTPPATGLVSLSHRQILRGFDFEETLGKAGLYQIFEYRHTLIGSTLISFPLATKLDRIQGVFFTGHGTISWPNNYNGLFTQQRIFSEVGYGLRFHFLLLGVSPYLLAIDFALPIHPQNSPEKIRSPFRFVLGITQTY